MKLVFMGETCITYRKMPFNEKKKNQIQNSHKQYHHNITIKNDHLVLDNQLL